MLMKFIMKTTGSLVNRLEYIIWHFITDTGSG